MSSGTGGSTYLGEGNGGKDDSVESAGRLLADLVLGEGLLLPRVLLSGVLGVAYTEWDNGLAYVFLSIMEGSRLR